MNRELDEWFKFILPKVYGVSPIKSALNEPKSDDEVDKINSILIDNDIEPLK